MSDSSRFSEKFGDLPIFGMLHLAGERPIRQALEEIKIFEEEGIDGAIVENYHGSNATLYKALDIIEQYHPQIFIGLNVLPNEFQRALPLADHYGADFVQLDHVAGRYRQGSIDRIAYQGQREHFPEVLVLGGVWPKYYEPLEGSDLAADLQAGMERADAIVVTGEGTGVETPLEKVRQFREVLGDFPLVVGAGLTPENAYDQLLVADGAIVGSCFKPGNDTSQPIDRARVRDFFAAVDQARAYRSTQE